MFGEEGAGKGKESLVVGEVVCRSEWELQVGNLKSLLQGSWYAKKGKESGSSTALLLITTVALEVKTSK